MAAPDANFKDLQLGDERGYEALGEVVRQAVGELAAVFEPNIKTGDEEKFRRSAQALIRRTELAIDGCCREAAKIVRCCTLLADVRATPTSSLAAELRKEAFGELDSFRQNIETIMTKLQPLTPELRRSYPTEMMTVIGILKDLPSSRSEYLSILKGVPERLLDYACAKCFAGQISLERQNKALEAVEAWIKQALREPAPDVLLKRGDKTTTEKTELIAEERSPKKCGYCGLENADEATACSGCGTPLGLSAPMSEAAIFTTAQPTQRAKLSWIVILGGGFLAVMTLAAIIGSIFNWGGRSRDAGYPFETQLVNSHGNGGWLLFDSLLPSYERGHSVPLEEDCQIKVMGPAERGPRGPAQTVDSAANPPMVQVTVISGAHAGQIGWVDPAAIGRSSE